MSGWDHPGAGRQRRERRPGQATIRRWQTRHRQGETMEDHTGRGRKPAMNRVAKIVVAKSGFTGTTPREHWLKKTDGEKSPGLQGFASV